MGFWFVWHQLFLSRYMQPVGLWQRQHAAALAIANKENNSPFPPVYPFPTPGPACAVIVGVTETNVTTEGIVI